MPKKLTIGFVKKEVEKFGYKCLSKEYVSSKNKLDLQCDKGHDYNVYWSSFQQGHRCPYCTGQIITIEEIKVYVEKFGYKCLSKEYVSSRNKLDLQCDKGHIYKASWDNFSNAGNRCPYCYSIKRGSSQRLTIEYVKEKTHEIAEGYECISEEYVNNYTKLKFICSNTHQFSASWTSFTNSRCPYCAIENNSGKNHYNWRDYSEEDRKNIKLYRVEVNKFSKINYKKYYYTINPFKYKLGNYEYHLDHIYSIMDGFNNGVLPEIIASPVNLQILWWKDNITKNSNSQITLEQLYDLHKQF